MTKVLSHTSLPDVPSLQHTLHHKSCPACAAARSLAGAEGSMGTLSLFSASEVWLSGKIARRLLPKTLECCRGHLAALHRFFGDIPLAELHPGSLRAYQLARSAGSGCFSRPVGASAVNHELNVLVQMLRRAGLWDAMRDFYAPLREAPWKPPRTFTAVEEALIFEAAALDPNLELAGLVFAITRNTTASGCELRGLRLRHIDLHARVPFVDIPPDATKNDIRPRRIALNAAACDAFARALDRARRCGAFQPHHYLFPYRVNRSLWDPNRPASRSWLRKQSQILRDRTGIAHLRPHAFRHLAVTEMLEAGVDEHTVIATAGWASRNMIRTYSHPRLAAIAEAVSVLDKKPPARVPSSNVIQFRPRA